MRKNTSRLTTLAPVAAALAMASGDSTDIASANDDGGSLIGRYASGDFHNHTTCSDGTLSLQKLVDKSANTFDLDWFVQAGHGGNSRRNCTLAEDPFEPVAPALGIPATSTIPSGGQAATDGIGPNQNWVDTLPGGADAIKGDVVLQNDVRSMWKWQEIQEFIYPVLEQESERRHKPIFAGLEQVVPGHEHSSTAVVTGQLPARGKGSASDMAQYEYCFDRADTDQSRGANNQWDCAVPDGENPLFSDKARKILIPSGVGSGTQGHLKTLEGIRWMAAFHPDTSYFVPAHLERAGAFNPDGNNGYNVEHLRNFHNAAPEIAFGFESMPGHQAEEARGSYGTGAVGGGTYGGSGIYAGAIGGVWDALLGEGRHWWFFASSDFHNRGSFGPDARESTADFFPGEYTKDYVLVRPRPGRKLTPSEIVDGLRSGNSYVANGGLIDQLSFVACVTHRGRPESALLRELHKTIAAAGSVVRIPGCATMGETLTVRPGESVYVQALLRDPEGKNYAPYSFPNPSLAQIGVTQPLDKPVLDHVDLVRGDVTGKVDPSDTARYAGLIGSPAATNPSTHVASTFNTQNWQTLGGGWRRLSYRLEDIQKNQYVRLRGTNLPAATPYETDSQGNPLLDAAGALNIPCNDAACPAHMELTPDGKKTSSLDVAAWADLWFYSNPIFVNVKRGRE